MLLGSQALAQQQLNNLPNAQQLPQYAPVTKLFPGGGSPPPQDPIAKMYEGNPQYINEGHRLFLWYNCVGCHANGGGGMGPALMDNKWRYGSSMEQIFASIYQGRPNGMPSWAGKVPDGQIWALAAFVQSLSVPSLANSPQQAPPRTPPPPAALPQPPKSESPGIHAIPR